MAYESEIEKLKRRYDEKPEQWFAALADAHRKAGDLEQAVRIVEEGIKQRPNYVSGHIVLGRCLVDQGADDRAEKVFEEVLELDAENIIALKVLGDVSERRGNPEAARRWLGRLLEVDPMNDEAREMLERVSQPVSEPAPAINPLNPDVPIVTQSAARAAGVASNRNKTDEEEGADEPGAFSPRDSGKQLSVDSSTSVRDLLDAAASGAGQAEPPIQKDDSGFVIERAQEALPSGEHKSVDLPGDVFSEAETKMVSFDEPAPSFDPTPADKDDAASDLAAGTLDFVASEAAEPDVDPLSSLSDPAFEDPIDLEPAESPELSAPVESTPELEPAATDDAVIEPSEPEAEDEMPPLELEMQPEPQVTDPLPPVEEVTEDDLPEDVASIFASAPPISQLSPSDDAEESPPSDVLDAADVADQIVDTEAPTAEVLAVPTPEVEADFLPDDIAPVGSSQDSEPEAPVEPDAPADPVESEAPADLAAMLDAAFDPIPADPVLSQPAAVVQPEPEDTPAPEPEPVVAPTEEPEPEVELTASAQPETEEPERPQLDESVADVLVDESIVGSITAPEPEPEIDPPSPLVTETMAEVYASQGHFDQARDVYRQLLADSPGDDGLQKRLAALEERAKNAASRGDGSSAKKYAAVETGGESVRSMMTALLAGHSAPTEVATEEEVVFVTPSQPSPMEEAFGETGAPGGEPTGPASDGPSLASIFGDEPDPGEEQETGEAAVEEDAGLTYDGFYGSPDRTPASGDEPESGGDDDEEFKAWLQSLKS